jgi:hypothetical protein
MTGSWSRTSVRSNVVARFRCIIFLSSRVLPSSCYEWSDTVTFFWLRRDGITSTR